MTILEDFATIAKSIFSSIANLFSGIVEILLANPVLLFITLFLGLTTNKSLQIGKVFKAKG